MIERRLNGNTPRAKSEGRAPVGCDGRGSAPGGGSEGRPSDGGPSSGGWSICPDLHAADRRAMESVFGLSAHGDTEADETTERRTRAVAYEDSIGQWRSVRDAAGEWFAAEPPGTETFDNDGLLRELGLESAPPPAAPDLAASVAARRTSARRRAVFSRRAAGAFAGAALCCTLAALFLAPPPVPAPAPHPVGLFTGGFGSVRLDGSLRTGADEPAVLNAGSIVISEAGSGGTVTLGGAVSSILNESTEIEIAAADRVRLRRGEAWFRVRPGSGGLTVETPRGRVTVLGTSFGVRVGSGSARVEVSEGRVLVSDLADHPSQAPRTLSAGQALSATATDAGEVSARADGTNEPRWVREASGASPDSAEPALLPSLGGLQ